MLPECIPEIAGNDRKRHVLDQGGKAEPACSHLVMILLWYHDYPCTTYGGNWQQRVHNQMVLRLHVLQHAGHVRLQGL